MYYFFGAGNNCSGALKFFGKENVIAIVDNSENKKGTLFEDVPIITFDEFQKRYQKETVVITAYIKSNEIIDQLQKVVILNYFVCPYMQSGFWSANKIVKVWNLAEETTFAIYERNPIADIILREIEMQKGEKFKVIYLDEKERKLGSSIEADVLLNVSEESISTDIFPKCTKIFNLYWEIENEKIAAYYYLKQYKNIHKGETCFVLGNGPSLRKEDLDRLHKIGAISMASNGIYKVFGATKWRPDYYVIGDAIVYEKNKEMLPTDATYFIRDFYGNSCMDGNVTWYNSKGEKFYPGYPKFSDDLVLGVYGGRTVTYDMLQIAVYMGFRSIYLIGVDFSWGEDGKSTHFYASKQEDRMVKGAVEYRNEIEHAYLSARYYTDSHDINIYNATRGGNLEVFERKNLDDVLALIEKSR